MAKGVRTQPTSQNSTPTSQNLDFVYFMLYFPGFSSVLNSKPFFATSTWTIFTGTRLDRCGLKNECERFQYGTNLMARKFKKVELNIFDQQIIDFGHPSIQASRHPGIQAIQVSRHPDMIQASRHPDIQASRHPGIRASRHPCIQPSRHPGSDFMKIIKIICVLQSKLKKGTITPARDESDPHQTM